MKAKIKIFSDLQKLNEFIDKPALQELFTEWKAGSTQRNEENTRNSNYVGTYKRVFYYYLNPFKRTI